MSDTRRPVSSNASRCESVASSVAAKILEPTTATPPSGAPPGAMDVTVPNGSGAAAGSLDGVGSSRGTSEDDGEGKGITAGAGVATCVTGVNAGRAVARGSDEPADASGSFA